MMSKGHSEATAKAAIQGRKQLGGDNLTNLYREYGVSMTSGSGNPQQMLQQGVNDIIGQMKQTMIDLDRQWSALPDTVLTQEEKDAILNKAITEITPWYEKQKQQLEKGIQEGKIQSAEDYYLALNQSKLDLETQLKGYDISEAQTNEELADTLAQITSESETDLELKRIEWNNRLQQVDQQIAGSGFAGTSPALVAKERDMREAADLERQKIEQRAANQTTNTQREAKYDLERIRLARESAQRERELKFGDAGKEAQMLEESSATLGLQPGQALSAAEIQKRRLDRGTTAIYNPEEAQSKLEENRKLKEEETRLSLERDELALKQQRRTQQENALMAKKRETYNQYQQLIGRFM